MDDQGRFDFVYRAEGLPPGNYEMVATGKNSGLQAVTSFTLTEPLP